MDWIEADGGANRALESAFAVLNEGPPPMTARQQKTKKEQSRSWEEAGRQLMLEAFPRIYAQESEASRIERAEAFDTCWGVIEQHVQSAMESTDARVFASLLELAQRSHALCLQEANLLRRGLHPIPTGLVLAGGVNSADHVRTFPNLAAHLRQAGCYVALLPPSAFARSLAEALNSALRQLSGMGETSADQFEALAAWYAEEVGSGLPTATPPEAHPSAEDGDANGSRRLRARPMQEAAVVATQDQVANRGRPLVIVVESTEAVQPGTLEDLVSVLSEGYPRFPVTLVLGLTTTAAALHAALPSYLIDRALECHHFNLATAMARLDTLVEQVLLSKWPGLLLEGALVNTLWEHFLVHYFSPSIVVQGWKVAALEHFRTHPGALLVEAGLDGSTDALHAAVVGLHGAHATEIKRCVGGARGGASLADAVCAVPQAWRRWALGVHWMVIAAKATNLSNGESVVHSFPAPQVMHWASSLSLLSAPDLLEFFFSSPGCRIYILAAVQGHPGSRIWLFCTGQRAVGSSEQGAGEVACANSRRTGKSPHRCGSDQWGG